MKQLAVLISIVVLSAACDSESPPTEHYLAGREINGTRIDVPLGLFGAENHSIKISHDGKKLLFTGLSEVAASRGLWVLDVQTGEKQLLHIDGWNGDWSFDDKLVAANIGGQIFTLTPDGTNLKQITEEKTVAGGTSAFKSKSFFPAWSRVDYRIAYYLSIDYSSGIQGIWLTDAEGNDLGRMFHATTPSWGTNSEIIGAKGVSSTSGAHVFIVYSVEHQVLTDSLPAAEGLDNKFPRISPDGTRIVFYNMRGIYVMNRDGSGLKRIVPNHLYNSSYPGTPQLAVGSPTWFPGGKEILYERFDITGTERTNGGLLAKGVYSFYRLNIDSAISKSTLTP